jgi:hypothetical protein
MVLGCCGELLLKKWSTYDSGTILIRVAKSIFAFAIQRIRDQNEHNF